MSLRLRSRVPSAAGSSPAVLYTIPKKVVRLATQRNRIRRLLKEAVRKDGYFSEARITYCFRVLRHPGPLRLADVQRVIHQIRPEKKC